MIKRNRTFCTIGVIILVSLVILNLPNLLFDLPVGQTDQAHFFSLSKAVSLGYGLNDQVPNWINLPEIEKVKDYPFILTSLFSFMSLFINEIKLLNGIFLSPFFILFLIYSFLLTKKLTKNTQLSIIVTLFMSFNLRVYYFAIAGVWPFLIATFITLPSIFYFIKFIELIDSNKIKKVTYFFLALICNFLVIHSHQMMGAFLIFMECMLLVGYYLNKKIQINWPKINLSFIEKEEEKKDHKKLINNLILIMSILTIFLINALCFTLTSGRKGWLTSWMDYMLSPFHGFQLAWKYFLIFDGPLITILGVIGILVIIYYNEFKKLGLIVSGIIIILLPFLVLGDGKMATYCYKYYLFFYYLLALSFTNLIFKIRGIIKEGDYNKKIKNMSKLFMIILIISLTIQVSKVLIFMNMVEPAITYDEFEASQFLKIQNDSSILYINNVNEESSFKCFKWIYVFSESENFKEIEVVDYNLMNNYDLILILDKNKVNLTNQTILFEQKDIIILGN